MASKQNTSTVPKPIDEPIIISALELQINPRNIIIRQITRPNKNKHLSINDKETAYFFICNPK